MVRARGFTAAAVLTLALGIGSAAAVFSVVNAVLLRPLPYAEPGRLVSLSHTLVVAGLLRVEQSDASILFYKRHNRSFTHLGAYQVAAAGLGPVSGADPERVPACRISADVFPALRVRPLHGRLLSESDDRPGAPPVVILAERLWARKYAGDPAILHRAVAIDGVPHEVVGIMPGGVRFPAADTELWLPLRLDPSKTESAMFDYQAIARLRAGVSVDAAAADLQGLLPRLPDEFPGRMTRTSIEQTRMRSSVRPLAATVVGDSGRLLWLVLGAAGIVLAIACANVANLFLVRAEARRETVAVQRAIGASRSAILFEFASEGFMVAAAGGGLGVGAVAAAVPVLRSLETTAGIPRLSEVTVDATVLLAALMMILLAAVSISVLPVLRPGAASLSVLGPTTNWATAGRERHRAWHALVAAQVALALILLVGAGLMARSVSRLRSVQPGFDPAGAVTFRIALPSATYPDDEASVRSSCA